MYAEKLQCPYCGKEQNPHGFGQLERVNERNCQSCGKLFVFTVEVFYQAFIEADFTEPQTEETAAVDTLNRMIVDAPKDEVKAYISSEIMAAVSSYCRGYGKKQALIDRFSARTGYSVSKITQMLSRAKMMNEKVADMLSAELEKPFYITTVKSGVRGTTEWRIGHAEKPAPEVQAHAQTATDGMTAFEYIFGYSTIKESRRIDPADIPAYLKKLSEKKEHRDAFTGNPKKWELLKVNGVKVKQEDAA